MKVDFHLRRRPEGEPAVAAWLPGRDAGALLGVCEGLGLDPTGRVFDVAGGFLLKLAAADAPADPGRGPAPRPGREPADPRRRRARPGAARRRGRGAGPRPRPGLPARRPASSASTPAPRSARTSLLVARPLPRRDWRPLPEPPEAGRADRGDRRGPAGRLAGVGARRGRRRGTIGTESPRPEASEPGLDASLGKAALGAGRGMARLGKALGWEKLAELGRRPGRPRARPRPEAERGRARPPGRGPERPAPPVPRRGRRTRPPAGPPPGRAGRGRGGRCRTRATSSRPGDLSYDLNGLLERRSQGGVWLGGHDVMAELSREYRKAAERGARAGATTAARRPSTASSCATTARRPRPCCAAGSTTTPRSSCSPSSTTAGARPAPSRRRARSTAPCSSTARCSEHEAAGDLLRRVGEEDAALAEYLAAADRLAASAWRTPRRRDLLLDKAGRPDLALAHFAAGWARRPLGNAVPCALRIARLHAERGDAAALRALIDEADAYFEDVEPGPRCGPILQRGGRARRSPRAGGDAGGAARPGAAGARRPAPPTRPPGREGEGGSPRSSWDRKAAGPPRSSATRTSPSRPRRGRPPRRAEDARRPRDPAVPRRIRDRRRRGRGLGIRRGLPRLRGGRGLRPPSRAIGSLPRDRS